MASDPTKSEYNQSSFIGGMNMLLEDTHLNTNQYVAGFNLRNRYDRLDNVLSSKEDTLVPKGIIQEHVTFGLYTIIFVSGSAYYKFYTNKIWTKIPTFAMSKSAPRYWTEQIPVSTTNYLRIAASVTINSQAFANSAGTINLNSIAGAAAGNLPGLLVQDNINQPQFIFIDATGKVTSRITQNFQQWSITFTSPANVIVATDPLTGLSLDNREYVPIGNVMRFVDGVLYIASPDGNKIFRSVSGRPLDFVIAVPAALATVGPPYIMNSANSTMADATQTSYSVGVGPITTLRGMSDNSLFVGAGNANFSVSKDRSPNALLEFGEYRLIRTFLFNATCLSDRAIFDSIGDTRFIDLTGVRSFNAIEQTKNEGRNTPFTADIRSAFGSELSPIIQDATRAAAILFNDYELYAVETIFGPAIAVYDTTINCWVGFDLLQTGGKKIKILSKIELSVIALYAVTEDNRLFQLYVGPGVDQGQLRPVGICSNLLYANLNIKMANPRMEIKPVKVRGIINKITSNCTLSMTMYVNNRQSAMGTRIKRWAFVPPVIPSVDPYKLDDIDTNLWNFMYSVTDCEQGWKCFTLLSWTNGSLTQFSVELNNLTPQNPLNSQVVDVPFVTPQQTTHRFNPVYPPKPVNPPMNQRVVLANENNSILEDENNTMLAPDI